MTTFDQLPIEFPSAPIEGETLSRVRLVSDDWIAEWDWRKFEDHCRLLAVDGVVDPNVIRESLTTIAGDLAIEPKRYAAFWAKATSKAGFLDNIPGPDGWTTNTDTAGGNAGKPIRLRRLRAAA